MIQRLDLEKEAIFPLILKMSWPSIIAMTAMSLYNFIDTFWLARFSSQALAAITICFPIQLIAAAIGVGTGIGAGSFSARMLGSGKNIEAKQTAGQTFFLSFFFGFICILFVLFFGDSMLIVFGASQEILPLCHDYLYLAVYSSPFLFFSMSSCIMLRAEGRPLQSMYVVVIALISSAILDPFLIFGIGPFPRMGIKGAALATIIAQFVMFIFSLIFLQLKSSKFEFKWEHIIPDIQIIKSIYSTGFPTMVINFIISIVLIIYNHVLADFGFHAVAAFGICFRVTGLASMVLFGIGAGLMPIVGFSAGARLFQRLKESVFVALKISLVFSVAAVIILEIFAPQIVEIFSTEHSLTAIAIPALRIQVSGIIFAAPILIFINMFLGLGKGTLAMVILFIRDILFFIPLSIIMPFFWGITGAWLALPSASLIELSLVIYWAKKELQRFKE
ncbi:MAG: MATE family efflux transporter [Syntrophaceae bacterium]|nr:MATE family efflux transporter [Syntrophaceae bacterium]